MNNKQRMERIYELLTNINKEIREVLELACVDEFTTGFRKIVNDQSVYKPFIEVPRNLMKTAEQELEHWEATKDMTDTEKCQYFLDKAAEEQLKYNHPTPEFVRQHWEEIKDMTIQQRCDFFLLKMLGNLKSQCIYLDDSSSD